MMFSKAFARKSELEIRDFTVRSNYVFSGDNFPVR